MLSKKKKDHIKELYRLFLHIKNKADVEKIFADLLTKKEVESIAERWQIFKKLAQKEPHREISHSLKVSIAKVTRGSHAMQKSKGGFRILLKKI